MGEHTAAVVEIDLRDETHVSRDETPPQELDFMRDQQRHARRCRVETWGTSRIESRLIAE